MLVQTVGQLLLRVPLTATISSSIVIHDDNGAYDEIIGICWGYMDIGAVGDHPHSPPIVENGLTGNDDEGTGCSGWGGGIAPWGHIVVGMNCGGVGGDASRDIDGAVERTPLEDGVCDVISSVHIEAVHVESLHQLPTPGPLGYGTVCCGGIGAIDSIC